MALQVTVSKQGLFHCLQCSTTTQGCVDEMLLRLGQDVSTNGCYTSLKAKVSSSEVIDESSSAEL